MKIAFLLTFLLWVANTTVDQPPDLIGIAAIITAVVGALGFAGAYWKGWRNSQLIDEVEQSASYVKGFDALIKRLEQEIHQLREEREKLEKELRNVR